jgi:hypothetical protein
MKLFLGEFHRQFVYGRLCDIPGSYRDLYSVS